MKPLSPILAPILAIDTTGPHGSIALVDTSGVIEEVPMESPDGFAHVVFAEIEALLQRHKIGLGAIGGFASASGPGSFTGVRVGLTAVKGLAEATGKQVIAISNLKALAWFGTGDYRATVIDARRGEVYSAVYNSRLEVVRNEVVIKLSDWLASLHNDLPEDRLEFITQGLPIAEAGVRGPILQAPASLAGAIGQIALRDFHVGLGDDPAKIDANYVRRSDAELLWREPDTR